MNELIGTITIGLVIMIMSHALIKHYALAGLVAGAICTVTNLVYEGLLNGFPLRPADVIFWIPSLLVTGFVLFTPPAFLVGLPLKRYRKKKSH